MRFVNIRERKVYEMVFEVDDGEEITFEIDDATRRRFIDAVSARVGARSTRPSMVHTTSDQPLEVEYEDNEILADMNERLASLGLPLVGDEEAEDVDQV
jgi:hypothetical protein